MGPILKPPPVRPVPGTAPSTDQTVGLPAPRCAPLKRSVEEVVDDLRSFVRSQVAVARRMARLRPAPTREEIRHHTRRLSTHVRGVVANVEDEKAFIAAVEERVARPVAEAINVADLETAIAAALAFCDGKNEATAEASLLGSAVSGIGSDILKAVERLWPLDVNRLVAGVDYEIDLQGRSRGYEHDAAPGPLFSNVDERVWQIPTFQLFYPLLHLYHAETGVEEHFTRAQIDAQRAFLHNVCRTPCMRFAQAWLVANKKIRVRNAEEFETMLWEMWFGLYRRDGYRDSSAFEHVFVGEVDNGQVRGMHNFLQLYREENAGNLDYYGYLLPRPRPNSMICPSNLNNLLTIRFSWRGVTKAASSVMFGVSPEFELALYTMLFIAGGQENNVRLGQYRVCVKVYQMGNKIAAAYPEALAPTPEEAVDEAVTVVQSAFRRRHEVQDLHRRKRDDADLSKKVERLISIGGQRGKLFGLW